MLVLQRKIGEKINVGDDIEFIIIKSSRKYVTVGINAPKEIPINREEIYNRFPRARKRYEQGK